MLKNSQEVKKKTFDFCWAAMGKGIITPELTAAIKDKTFNTSLTVQQILMLIIILLMVLKPF